MADPQRPEPGLVDRPWLSRAVAEALADPACRIVLLSGPMGAGKSTFLEHWSAQHPDALLYSLRRDSFRRDRSSAANDLLQAIGEHFAHWFPWLFEPGTAVDIDEAIGRVAAGGSVTGAHFDELVAPSFAPLAIRVRQRIGVAEGAVTAVRIGRLVWDMRLADTETAQYLALFDPAARAAGQGRSDPLIVIIDALDELAGLGEGHPENIIRWLEQSPAIPSSVRLVISSRPGRHLAALCRVHREGLREIRFGNHQADAADDLARYCRAALGGPARDAGLELRRSRWIRQLVSKAQANFLFVALLFKQFAERGYDLARRDAELPALDSVPDGLASLYDDILDGLRGRVGDRTFRPAHGTGSVDGWSEVYEPVLGVLSTAAEPVTAEQIAGFADLPVPARVVREALARMTPLLASGTTADGVPSYAVVHLSLAQHLSGDDAGPGSPFALDPSEWHARTAAWLWRGTGLPWLDEQDQYRVRHLALHLRGSQPADRCARGRLATLLQDPAFVARLVEVAGAAAALAEVGAGAQLISTGADGQALAELYEALSVGQAALQAGSDPLTTIANGLTAGSAAPAIADQAWRLAGQRARPYARLTQALRMPRPPQRRQLGGSLGHLTGCATDARGDLVLTSGDDGLIRLWDRREERELRAVRAGDMPTSCAMSRDGATLAGGYADGTVAVWREADEPVLRKRAGGSVAGVAVGPAGLVVAASLDGRLTAWQAGRPGRPGRTLWSAALGSPLHCCAWSGPGTAIAGDETGALHVVSAARRVRIAAHDAAVRACAGYPDGSRAITGSYDGTLAVWDLRTGARHATLRGHDSAVFGCSLAAEARLAVSASLDGTSRLWDPDGGRELGAWAPHDDHITCCAVDDGGRWIVTGSTDRTARYWPVPAPVAAPLAGRHHGEVVQCVLVGAGRTLVTAATDRSLRQWQAHDLTVPGKLLLRHTAPVIALAASAGAPVILIGDAQGNLVLGRDGSWQTLVADGALVTSCALSGDGRTALTGDESGDVQLWRLDREPRRIALPAAHDDWILRCALSDDGARAMSADNGENSAIQFWDLGARRGDTAFRLPGKAAAWCLPRDGRLVTAALTDGRVRIHDRSGELLAEQRETSGERIVAVGASPDGSRCATVTRSGRLSHWTSGRPDLVLGIQPPSAIAISDDLACLAIGQSLGDLSVYHLNPSGPANHRRQPCPTPSSAEPSRSTSRPSGPRPGASA